MSTVHKCDICHKKIKNDKPIMVWGGVVPTADICLICWLDSSCWQLIHKVEH